MTRKIATVSEGTLYGEQTHWCSIWLDSPAWFAWLEAPEHCGFAYALFNPAQGYIDGFMTVRKERRQRGGVYWTAYRRAGHRVRKVYLGPSATLTEARLMAAAVRLHARDDPQEQAAAVPALATAATVRLAA
jgi:LuxR family maltose regulon positive regulatory protein